MKRNWGGTHFFNRGAAPWPPGGKRRHLLPWLRARAWRPHYWGASGSHAPAEAMSRILSGRGRSRTDSANSLAAFWAQNKNDNTWQFWRGKKRGRRYRGRVRHMITVIPGSYFRRYYPWRKICPYLRGVFFLFLFFFKTHGYGFVCFV